MRVFIPRFLGAIAYLVALTVVGAVGYVVIEGWPWREALYMTVITLTAVGFGSPPTFGARPGLYDGSCGSGHHWTRRLVRPDHIIHPGIRPE